MLIQLVISLLSISHGGSLFTFFLLLSLQSLFLLLVISVLLVDLFTLLVELDDQVMLLGICEPNVISLHIYLFCFSISNN